MAKYKVVVQIYKDFEVEAPSQADAMRAAEDEIKKLGIKDRYNVNHARELGKPKKKISLEKVDEKGNTVSLGLPDGTSPFIDRGEHVDKK